MTIEVYKTERAAAKALARHIAERLGNRPSLVLGLPTGRTPILLYEELVRLYERGEVDFAEATTFNLDEFVGIAATHPGSYRSFMNRHLFNRVNLDPLRIHFLDGTAQNLDAECERYDAAIEAAGGIDVLVVGIGTNGHIGFNEPGRTLEPRTHRVQLRPETRRANASLFDGGPGRVPEEALSMGMTSILHAREIVLLATGRRKSRCVARALREPISTRLPASFLQLHRDLHVVLDEGAAERLNLEASAVGEPQ